MFVLSLFDQIQTTGPNVKYSGVAGTLAKIYKNEGLIGYFKVIILFSRTNMKPCCSLVVLCMFAFLMVYARTTAVSDILAAENLFAARHLLLNVPLTGIRNFIVFATVL